MTIINGIHPIDAGDGTQSQLGKRKRSSSPKVEVDDQATTQDGITRDFTSSVLKIIQDNDPSNQLLEHALSSVVSKDGPMTKRRRTQSTDHVAATIGARLNANTYQTLDQLIKDLSEIRTSVESQSNGHEDTALLNGSDIRKIADLVAAEYEKQSIPVRSTNEDVDAVKARRPALQLLSLRGQTDGGVRQLFTGLPRNNLIDSKDADTKQLPNGFELIDSALMNAVNSMAKDNRTFGDVFTPYRSTKALEPPRQTRNQESQLDFIPTLSQVGSHNKQDYRCAALGTATWLSYATFDTSQTDGEPSRSQGLQNTATSLFRAAFSSFAPSVDHTTSVVTEPDRAKRWFNSKVMTRCPDGDIPQHPVASEKSEDVAHVELADNLDEIVQNYISEAEMDDQNESEKVLGEISDLIQTLSSYQNIRDLDPSRRPASSTPTTQSEIDTYEILRVQLQLVIDALPPHAVAKLNGDQLAALNIGTELLFAPPEITGTAQADDFTLRKHRGVQGANNLAGRGTAVPTRPNYVAPNSSYTAQVPAYAQNNASAISNAVRQPAAMYNTSRGSMPAQTPQYAQQPFRASSTAYATPVSQSYSQFNSAKYNQAYVPKASQPGYQQRAQERASTWQRPDSPHQPLANSQTSQQYQARSHAAQSQAFTNSPAQSTSAMQQKLLEPMKQQQSAQPDAAV